MWTWFKRIFTKPARPSKADATDDYQAEKDPLLKQARLIMAQSRAAGQALKKHLSKKEFFESLGDQAKPVQKSAVNLSRFYQTIASICGSYVLPVFRILRPLGTLLSSLYGRIYRRFAFAVGPNGNRDVFSRSRSAATVVSLAVMTVFLSYHIIWNLVPLTLSFAYDLVAVNLFAYEDVLYFSKPDWVEGSPGVLNVFACKRYPCKGQDDSIEFRMRDSIYLDVIRTFTKLEPHDPGELAGAFLSEENACIFRAYGKRVKYLGWYPYIFESVCRPVSDANAGLTLEEMRESLSKQAQ